MGNRTAKFISALVGSIIAGVPLAAVSQNAPAAPNTASAASDCLASPKGTAPQGQHWFYRLDRATKRQCWYLRAEGAKATQSAQATADTQNAESAAPPSVQNARAEYIAPQPSAAPNMTAPAPVAANRPPATPPVASTVPDSGAEQPAVTARWPDAFATAPAPAPVAVAAKPAKPAAPVALAAADSSADKPTGSLQMLLLAIGGALALAGILASVVYRFAGGRVRVQANDHRRVNWDDFEPHDLDDDRAPWLNATSADAPRAPQPHPIDFDAARPQTTRPQQAPQLAAFSSEIAEIAAQYRSAHDEVTADLDEADIFNGEFEIEAAAPQLVANEARDDGDEADQAPAGRDEDAVDIDVITSMLERLAQEGPRLSQPSPEAGLADFARSQRGQSAARA
ncbi:hypothetical protein PMI42_00852 [Bradyrhizobium sp. YR681]|uniref:hypothetical protein n=1 Tax=Bradyrhizobium sp. YR681 TaxID=1144344 RepID=UPI000270FD09|nr:hypothetical protein [Bradyrhizobium sp. YR681]EJN15560.1 hypothetical protein PMI42_00852 [Bradyrhizobium sp. YR681]